MVKESKIYDVNKIEFMTFITEIGVKHFKKRRDFGLTKKILHLDP